MPCRDMDDDIRYVYKEGHDPLYKKRFEGAQVLLNERKKRLDELTDLLCKAGRARYNKTKIPKEVLQWWDEHCKIDRARGEPW